NEVWKNPAFGPELAGTQNEGTYVTDIIVPSIRATLRRLPIGKTGFISTAERQSVASADRKGKSGTGKRPDIMFIINYKERIHELTFAECSRLVCTEDKEKTDQVKLWREMNDGLFWSRKACKPDKGEFGIIGVQVAAEIPVQKVDGEIVFNFVELLLNLRNILIVNLSLLFHAQETGSHESSESSSTLRSPRREKQERTKTRKVSERSPSRKRGRLNKKKSRDLKKG
ncbi:10202_t:CDS:2, partial [Racocetra persica]